jgi:hypothetical protein
MSSASSAEGPLILFDMPSILINAKAMKQGGWVASSGPDEDLRGSGSTDV